MRIISSKLEAKRVDVKKILVQGQIPPLEVEHRSVGHPIHRRDEMRISVTL